MVKTALFVEIFVAIAMLGCTRSKPLQDEHRVNTASNLVSNVTGALADSHHSGSLVYEGVCTDSERIWTP